MMMREAPGAPCLVDPATQCAPYRIDLSYQVIASASRMGGSIVAWYHSGLFARLAGHNNATCPSIL
jgi:hypothetical protein